MTGRTAGATLSECRDLLARLRQAAGEAALLVSQGDPAEGVVNEMERMASRAEGMLRGLTAEPAGGQAPEIIPGVKPAELHELLADSLQRLRTAREYARVNLEGLQRELDEAAQGQRGVRAYQASLVDRPGPPG